jgi:hypothetical protein
MTDPIPYPARRRYRWAREGRTMTYTDAVRHFTNMRYQASEDRNPQRWATLTMMLEALDLLQHDGHDDFAGTKLHKLLIKCAARCGWVTDLSAMQRKLRPTPIDGDPDKLHCYDCDRDLPRSAFRTLMTDAQRQRYNKPEGTRQYIMARRCADCRDNAKESKRRKLVRTTAARKRREFVRLTEQRQERGGDIYRVYLLDVRHHIESTRKALSKAACTGTRREFYEFKLATLLHCHALLEQHLADNTLDQLSTERVSWLNIASPEDQAEVMHKYRVTTLDTRQRGRSPVLETPLVTKREMPLIKTKKAKG